MGNGSTGLVPVIVFCFIALKSFMGTKPIHQIRNYILLNTMYDC